MKIWDSKTQLPNPLFHDDFLTLFNSNYFHRKQGNYVPVQDTFCTALDAGFHKGHSSYITFGSHPGRITCLNPQRVVSSNS